MEDHRSNPDEFPEFFPLGVFEGFWWAAVTMTTVGYGDKVPRSIPSRLFAVIWINAGLVIIAMFMGIVTASLSTSIIGQDSHLYGLAVAAKNGSAEYQHAVFHSADVQVKNTFEDIYSGVSKGESQIALVDLYTTTYHEAYLETHKLYVASVLEHSIAYGAVLPRNSDNLSACLKRYEETHKDESYFLLDKYLTHVKDPNSGGGYGTDYFDHSIFGYAVYAMTGSFLVCLGIGLWWQKYYRPRRGEWREEQETQGTELREIELATPNHEQELHAAKQSPSPRMLNSASTATRGTERLMAQQSSELLRIMEEYKAYKQSWQKSFGMLQERHRKEQREMFQLDKAGYDM